jgi:PIN domain nuclease of toxin-antitoxin system
VIIIFDAGALIALLRLEPGALAVRQMLRRNPGRCYIHAVNLYEIYYGFARAAGVPTAQRAVQVVVAAGVMVREDMDTAFWQDAGQIKAAHRLSIADTFGLALARRMKGEFLTTDHHEMDALVPLGLCPIRFIR